MIRLTREQVREVDRRAIEEYHIPGIVLMENASRSVADMACEMLRGDGDGDGTGNPSGGDSGGNCLGKVLILCGGGNNGGDGLAVARHLHNRGTDVTIALATDPDTYQGDALVNWRIVQAMGLPVTDAGPEPIEKTDAALLIDAVFGTGLTKSPRDPFPALVAAVARSALPVLAIDLPSGLDCNTGRPLGACIRATRTVTFVAEKAGFAAESACPYLGIVTVGDIGCPTELIARIVSEA